MNELDVAGIVVIAACIFNSLGCKEQTNCSFALESNNGKLELEPCSKNCLVSIKSQKGTELRIRFIAIVDGMSCTLEVDVPNSNRKYLTDPIANIQTYSKDILPQVNSVDISFSCLATAGPFSVQWDISDLKEEGNIDKLLTHFTNKQLAITIIGLIAATLALICCVVCLCRKLRSSNIMKRKDIKMMSYQDEKSTSVPTDKETHPRLRMEVQSSSGDIAKDDVPGVKNESYDEITEDLLSPIDPKKLNKITEEGYLMMSILPDMEHYDVPSVQKPVPPPKQKNLSPFRAISALFRGRKPEGEQNDYTNFDSQGSPLKKLKNMDTYSKRQMGTSSTNSESGIMDITKWRIY